MLGLERTEMGPHHAIQERRDTCVVEALTENDLTFGQGIVEKQAIQQLRVVIATLELFRHCVEGRQQLGGTENDFDIRNGVQRLSGPASIIAKNHGATTRTNNH